jgi:hypothetical protein
MDKKPKRAKKGLVSFGPGFCTAGVKWILNTIIKK